MSSSTTIGGAKGVERNSIGAQDEVQFGIESCRGEETKNKIGRFCIVRLRRGGLFCCKEGGGAFSRGRGGRPFGSVAIDVLVGL